MVRAVRAPATAMIRLIFIAILPGVGSERLASPVRRRTVSLATSTGSYMRPSIYLSSGMISVGVERSP